MPIIKTKPDLPCSCTLMYLIQYKKIYEANGVNPMETDSTRNCLNSANFNKLISDCRFENKLSECSGLPITTKSSKTDDYDGFQTATIILSILSAFFLVLLIFVIYWYKFRKIASQGGSMSFSTFAADKKVIISS